MPVMVSFVGQSFASRLHFNSSSKCARHQITESIPYRLDICCSSTAHHACTGISEPSCTRGQPDSKRKGQQFHEGGLSWISTPTDQSIWRYFAGRLAITEKRVWAPPRRSPTRGDHPLPAG